MRSLEQSDSSAALLQFLSNSIEVGLFRSSSVESVELTDRQFSQRTSYLFQNAGVLRNFSSSRLSAAGNS